MMIHVLVFVLILFCIGALVQAVLAFAKGEHLQKLQAICRRVTGVIGLLLCVLVLLIIFSRSLGELVEILSASRVLQVLCVGTGILYLVTENKKKGSIQEV